jgi:hypothetical protein
MSKKIKFGLIAGITLITLSWAGWQLLKPQPNNNSYTQKEISIKQTEIPNIKTLTYRDWSGFQFDYPSILTVKEVELDNPAVYSSLEISGSDGKKLTVRVSDTSLTDLVAWQQQFSKKNSISEIDQTMLADIPAIKIRSATPTKMLTVAVAKGINYEIASEVDDGFWDQTHEDLVASWQFLAPETDEATATEAAPDETITLVEETLE